MRCQSLRGHKYEARYDLSPAIPFEINLTRASEVLLENLVEKHRHVTYVRDVCVRCGHTIEREHPK